MPRFYSAVQGYIAFYSCVSITFVYIAVVVLCLYFFLHILCLHCLYCFVSLCLYYFCIYSAYVLFRLLFILLFMCILFPFYSYQRPEICVFTLQIFQRLYNVLSHVCLYCLKKNFPTLSVISFSPLDIFSQLSYTSSFMSTVVPLGRLQ